MSEQDPPRLLDSASPYARSLLRAGESELPDQTKLASLAVKLGPIPQGLLSQEREVIAIEALTQTGRLPEAQARAARFAASYPHSTHLRRVETLVGTKF